RHEEVVVVVHPAPAPVLGPVRGVVAPNAALARVLPVEAPAVRDIAISRYRVTHTRSDATLVVVGLTLTLALGESRAIHSRSLRSFLSLALTRAAALAAVGRDCSSRFARLVVLHATASAAATVPAL